MVSISKIRQLINASHDTFISYSFLSQWKWRPFRDKGDTCDESIDQTLDTNQKKYNPVLSITTKERNPYVEPK
jgi:hypothetical protein